MRALMMRIYCMDQKPVKLVLRLVNHRTIRVFVFPFLWPIFFYQTEQKRRKTLQPNKTQPSSLYAQNILKKKSTK